MNSNFKQLYAHLLRLNFAEYLISRSFKNIILELDLDDNWKDRIADFEITETSKKDDYEDAFLIFLNDIEQDSFYLDPKESPLLRILFDFFKSVNAPLDYIEIHDHLKSIGMEDEHLKYFKQKAKKIFDRGKSVLGNPSLDLKRNLKKVFIIHGHDELSRLKLEKLLKEFNLLPIVLMDLPGESLGTIISKFEKEAGDCSTAIALFTPDDEMKIGSSRPRQNVILELGYFMGRDRNKERQIIVLKKSGTEGPSDINGVETINFEKSIDEVAHKLQNQLKHWEVI
jgi:predicted nucleotide-binding protein